MKFTINSSLFKKIVEAIKDVVKDASLEFCPYGLVLNAMDASHVALIYMTVKDSLLDYTCEKNEVIGLNTEVLFKIIKTCDLDAQITCENKQCKMDFVAISKDRSMNFTQNLLDLETEAMMIPDIDFPCKIEMPCSEFLKICRDLREFGDDVRVTLSPKILKFYTSSCGQHIEIDYSNNDAVKVTSEAAIEMSYSLKYLMYFCKACALSDNVFIYMGTEQPMCVKFPICEKDYISFYLAPKLDEL